MWKAQTNVTMWQLQISAVRWVLSLTARPTQSGETRNGQPRNPATLFSASLHSRVSSTPCNSPHPRQVLNTVITINPIHLQFTGQHTVGLCYPFFIFILRIPFCVSITEYDGRLHNNFLKNKNIKVKGKVVPVLDQLDTTP